MDTLRIMTAGSVDDGKSTLIGRLLFDSHVLLEDQLHAIRSDEESRNVNLAFVTDGLKAEREHGITIDVAYRYFTTPKRKFILADTPGHAQYTRNMVTAATVSDVALLTVDVRNGLVDQTRRHCRVASLFGIRTLLVCVNKMDLVDFRQLDFDRVVNDIRSFTRDMHFDSVTCVPISALHGDNVVHPSSRLHWYDGDSLLSMLENIAKAKSSESLRISAQSVGDKSDVAVMVWSGSVRVGGKLRVLPQNFVVEVMSIITFDGALPESGMHKAVTLKLSETQNMQRGSWLLPIGDAFELTDKILFTCCWLNENPLSIGSDYLFRIGAAEVLGTVETVETKLNDKTWKEEKFAGGSVGLNDIAQVRVRLNDPMFFEKFSVNRYTGSAVIIYIASGETLAAAVVT